MKRIVMLAFAGAVIGSTAACGFKDPLRVEDPDNLTADELTGSGALSTTFNGILGAFHEATDDYVRYSSMFTDEMILAGTFPTRLEVDDRRILRDNSTITTELYEILHTARFLADTAVIGFQGSQGDPDLADFEDLLLEGIAAGKLYGGFSRILLAELYCESALSAGPYLISDDRMADALALLQEAEQAAIDAGRSDFQRAAIVGQARAHLWLRQDAQARTAAQRVPAGFVYLAEYSENDNIQFNEVYSFTRGRGGQVIRWTVGDGTSGQRNNERFGARLTAQGGYATDAYAEWVALGLINPNPGLTAFNSTIPVRLQLLYTSVDADIIMASKAEADMIEAEVLIRAGDVASLNAASAIVNTYRTAFGLAATDFAADPDLQTRLIKLAQDKNRELWLTGERQGTFRRLRERNQIDLYPLGSVDSMDQICFPVPQQEVDNNTNSLNFP